MFGLTGDFNHFPYFRYVINTPKLGQQEIVGNPSRLASDCNQVNRLHRWLDY